MSVNANIDAVGNADPAVVTRLNAVRLLAVLCVGVGYGSTMAIGPGTAEWLAHLGYDPSWFGLNVLFLLSGFMAWRSVSEGRTGLTYLRSRARRTLPALALYTLAVASVLYPLLCNPERLDADGIGMLLLYVTKTVTLVSPGGVMPGALDEQPYMCLLQGTVWTLRWGAVLHLGTLVLHRVTAGRTKHLLIAAAGSVAAYWVAASLFAGGQIDALEPVTPALRFSYPWLLGASVFALRHRLPRTGAGWGIVALLLMGLAGLHHEFAGWSPLIDVLATSSWASVALALLHTRARWLRGWPPLALPVYLGLWPVAQTLLYLVPTLSVTGLILLTLAVSVGLAATVYWVSSGVFRPPAASQLKRPRTA